MLGAGYFYLAAGLIVPGFFLFFLWAVWGALVIIAIMQWRNIARLWILVAVMVGVWVTVVIGIGSLLDWMP